jgi:hypothetical protein
VEDLTLQQKRVWRALQKQDAQAFKELVAPEFLGINYQAVRYTRDDGLNFIAHYKMTQFTLSDVKALRLSRDSAVLTYRVKYQGVSIGGDDAFDRCMINSAVLVRREGKWQTILGQETWDPAGARP